MYTKIKILAVFVFLLAGKPALAGIPTVDVGAIAQAIMMRELTEKIHHAKTELQNKLHKEGYDQAERLANEAEKFLSDHFISDRYGWEADIEYIADSYYEIMEQYSRIAIASKDEKSFEESIEKYKESVTDARREDEGLKVDTDFVQKGFDKELMFKSMQEDHLTEINSRYELIEQLRLRHKNAKTPAERQDLLIAINIELLALQNETNRLGVINSLNEQDVRLEEQRHNQKIQEMQSEIEYKFLGH